MEKCLPKMKGLISREGLFTRWLAVESALASAQSELGIIPEKAALDIEKAARVDKIDFDRYDELFQKTNHPMVSLLKLLEEVAGVKSGQYIHLGATTQDIMDTGTVLLIKTVLEKLEEKLISIEKAVVILCEKYADTIMMGRTHNIHALPITFGHKAAIWASEIDRNIERIKEAKERICVLSLFAAAGSMVSFGNNGKDIQIIMAKELGLNVADISWHASRDRIGEFGNILALSGACFARIAQEIYLLMGTEFGELSEPWNDNKVGSSTMPHKVNPTSTQHMMSLARHLRYNAAELVELMAVDHERNIMHFGGEREKVESSCLYIAELMDHGEALLINLVVNEKRMLANVNLLGGLTQSEHVMLELGKKIGKQNAHGVVNQIAMESYKQEIGFLEALCGNEVMQENFSQEDINKLINPMEYIGECPGQAKELADKLRKKYQFE